MKRLKKILKWTGIVLGGLVAIGLVANAVFVWITDTRLERQLAAIREAGDPLTLAEMAPKPVPPEKNAATYLRRAKADVNAMSNEIYNKDYFDNWSKQWNEGHVLSPNGLKAVKASFKAHPNVMPLLERAAACTEYDEGSDYSVAPEQFITQLLPVVQGIRAHFRILEFRVYLLLAEGKHDEAVQTGLALLQIASLFDRSPMIISYLVATTLRGIAMDCLNSALQSGPVSKDMRDVLDAQLAAQECMDGYVWMIKSERASVLDLLRVFPDRHFWLVNRGIWNQRESAVLDWFGEWLAIAGDSDPYRLSEKRIHRLSMQVSMLDLPLLPAKIWGEPADLLPATQTVHHAITRSQAIIRCLRVLNALQIHVSVGSDEVPKLTELGLPAETTTDPYTGEPLHVKKTPQGWLVYSVGRNLQDDGGKLDNPVQGDVGVGPPPPAKSAEK